MNTSTPTVSSGDKLKHFTLSMIAEYTQYNIADLNLSCHFENDLGIDSVSLVEILAEINQRLNLSTPLSASGIHTIEDVITIVSQYADEGTLELSDAESSQSPAAPLALLHGLYAIRYAQRLPYIVGTRNQIWI